MLALIDGCDEFVYKNLKINKILKQKYNRLIATVRKYSATEAVLCRVFGLHDKIYISRFTTE